MDNKLVEHLKKAVGMALSQEGDLQRLKEELQEAKEQARHAAPARRHGHCPYDEWPTFSRELGARIDAFYDDTPIKICFEGRKPHHDLPRLMQKEVREAAFSLVEIDLSLSVRFANTYLGERNGDHLLDMAGVALREAFAPTNGLRGIPVTIGRAPRGARLYAITPCQLQVAQMHMDDANARIRMIPPHKEGRPIVCAGAATDVIRAVDLIVNLTHDKDFRDGLELTKKVHKECIRDMMLTSTKAYRATNGFGALIMFLADKWQDQDQKMAFLRTLPGELEGTVRRAITAMESTRDIRARGQILYRLKEDFLFPLWHRRAALRHTNSPNDRMLLFERHALKDVHKGLAPKPQP